jgi:hypothetical protein
MKGDALGVDGKTKGTNVIVPINNIRELREWKHSQKNCTFYIKGEKTMSRPVNRPLNTIVIENVIRVMVAIMCGRIRLHISHIPDVIELDAIGCAMCLENHVLHNHCLKAWGSAGVESNRVIDTTFTSYDEFVQFLQSRQEDVTITSSRKPHAEVE